MLVFVFTLLLIACWLSGVIRADFKVKLYVYFARRFSYTLALSRAIDFKSTGG